MCFPHPTLHTLASPSIWGCKCASHTYSYLTHTHPHLVTGQTARQFHEIFPIWCSLVLNTCVILSWYHTVSVSAASWFSFNPSWWTWFFERKWYCFGIFSHFEIIKQIFVSVETDVLLLRLSPANKKTRVMHENLFTYLRLFFQTLYIIDATTQRNERS